MRDKQRKFIAILSFVLIMLTTFAYSALATSLSITGEANFRTPANIRVTNIGINNGNGATSEYERFTKDTITTGFTLNSSSSTMSYNVTITNNGLRDQAIYNLLTQSSNNSGLSILIDGKPINQALPIIVPFGTSKTITITYSSSTPGRVDVTNKFVFREVYYITYNLKGGSSLSTDLTNGQIKYQNVDLKITEDEPTLSGYDFLGWTDEQNGTTVKYEPGDIYTIDGANKILYALYKKDNYTITFDAQDGSENQTKEVQVGDQIGTLPTHQRDGYHFDGWYTGQTDGTQITTTTVPDSDKTYYAHYTPYRLTINYYAGGATKNGNTTLSNQKLTTYTYNYDGEDLATAGLKNYDSASSTWNLVKDGYHADKYWHLGNNTSTTKVHEDTAIAKVQDLAASLNKGDDFKTGNVEVNIYAGWIANTYILHFDKNNASATGVMSDQTLTYDAQEANRKINKNIYTYTGHTFVGWNTQSNGQGTPYTDEQVINLVTTNNQTINLYAQWIAKTYTVTYDANGGEVSTPSKQVTYGDTYGTLPEPSKTGYTFNGWFTDNTYTTEVTSSTQVEITDNQTIIAKWTANDYTVTFNPNGGTVNPTSKSVTYDSAYGPLPEPSKTGYTFEGWQLNDNTITSSSIVKTSDNHTLYAQYSANELVFNNQTLSAGTYGTAYTSNAFDAASNGTGSYTYAIKSGAPTGATIDSANRKISFTNSTNAGTYNVVVTATDNNSGVTKDATMKIVINRQGINLPSCSAKTYNKSEQTLFEAHTSGSYTNSVLKATNAGTYNVALTPTSNYKWSSDDSTTSKNVSCTINKYNISSATVSTIPDHTYDNTVYKPTPSVTVPLPSSTNTYTLTDSEYDYSYSVASPKDVNTYTVTMTAKADSGSFVNNYTGSVSKTYKIVKANGYVNLSATTGSVTYGTASKTFTVSSSHGGTLSVSDDNTTATSSISNGTVTIGSLGSLASGTKVKVTVTSAATTNYKEATATYELTITNAAIDCGTVAITGNNVVGEKLTASTTSTPSDVTKTYQWYTNTSDSVTGGTAISGATSNEFTLTSAQVGKYIYATITCSKTNYTTASASGKATTTSNKTATTKTKVAKPTAATYCANPTYNGSAQTITNTAADGYAFTGNSATNYSSTGYDVTASLSTNYIWSDYTTANTTINCNITRRAVTYKADDQSKTYDSTALNANTNCTLTDGTLVSGHSATCATSGSQTNAGSSTKTLSSVTIMNGSTNVTANYNITKTNGTLTVNKSTPTGTIEVISTTTSSVTIKETTDTSYNMNHWQYKVDSGNWINFSYESDTSQTYTITNLTAGTTYTIYADFRDIDNTNWLNPKPSVSVTLPRISIDAPTGSNFTYDGKSHTGVSSGTGYTLTGDITKIDAGNYTATAKLDSQHKWSDGTTADKTISWKINPKTLTITAANKSMTYGGSAPTYTYTSSGEVSGESPISGTATYTIKSGSTTISNVSTATAGSYSINPSGLTINSNYTPNYVAGTLTINKAANPTTFTAVTGLKYGSTAAMVTVGSKQGTPYYSVGTELTASNYSTAGSTTIPTASSRNAGTYTIYYYIPEVSGKYNVKSGSVSVTIAKTSCPLTVSNGSMYTGATMTLSTRASNNVGTLSYALKSGGNNTTTASTISNGVLTAGAMSTANDNNQTVDVQITEAASTNYNSCTKDVAITVQKNTRTLSWSSTTPAENATLTYGTSYSATASASGSGGTAGSITYASNNETGATINSSSGAITVANGNSKAVTITATMARTATVAQATTTRAFTTGKANGYVNLSANSGSVTYGTTSKSFTVSSSHGGELSVSDNNSTASCAISGTTVTCSSLGSINAGTSITVTVTSAATDNYKEASKTYTLSITRATTATTGSCLNPTYNGSAQNIAGGGSNVTYSSNNSQTNHSASNISVSVTPNANYAWSDGTYAAKTLSCNIEKATPVITLSSSSGTLNAGATASITATVKSGGGTAAGTLTASSGNTEVATVAPTSTSLTAIDNSTGKATSEVITAVSGGSVGIYFNFTPTDTTNYNSATQKQYALTSRNKVTITTNKDGSAWSSGYTVKLYQSGTAKYTLTTSGSTASTTNVAIGTYDVYATKSSLDSTLVDTGVDITIDAEAVEDSYEYISNATATIKYCTLTLNKGSNVTTVTGAGIYLSYRTVSISASGFSTGYHFGSWSKTEGNTPTSTTSASTTVSTSAKTTLQANAAINTYTIAFNNNGGSGTMTSLTSKNYNTSVTLTSNSFTRSGYTFIGWNTEADGTGTAYLNGASMSINSSLVSQYGLENSNGTITLYAQWIKNGSVKITGTNKVGNTLTATVTAPTPTPASYSYQWYRGSTAISGATSSTYTPVDADIGSTLKVKVTANYSSYNSVTFEDTTDATNNTYANTNGTLVCTNAVAKITGNAVKGSTLTATVTTSSSPSTTTYSYQWYRGSTAISGATSSTYTTVAADVGKTIKVVVTATKTNYVSCTFNDSIDETNNKSDTVIEVRAVDLYYDNSNTGMTCETAQCAIDNISRILTRSGAKDEGNDYLCRRATSSELHTDYGQVGTAGTLASGDAFICDVNGDGTYNAENEMFYYVSDYYDTSTQTTNSDYATLIYYNNVSAGSPSNTTYYAYDSSGENWHGPRTAIMQLPTTLQWQDIGLYKNSRAILSMSPGGYAYSRTSGGDLPTDFSYKGYSTRLLTELELINGFHTSHSSLVNSGYFDDKTFMLENIGNGYWLETPYYDNSGYAWYLYSSKIGTNSLGNSARVRPVIEVKKTDMNLNLTPTVSITFNSNGGTGTMSNQEVTKGSTEKIKQNEFTHSRGTFIEWNTQADGSGTSYADKGSINLSSNITLYAQWQIQPLCKRVTNAADLHTEICNSSYNYCNITYATGETITYGNAKALGQPLVTGDAFDCKVSSTGDYTERFYYVSDYFDTQSKTFNSDYATLVYANNVYGGVTTTTDLAKYSTSNNLSGPTLATPQLPTTSQWDNISLYKTSRQIMTINGVTKYSSSTLPVYSYSGKAARLLTFQEISNTCYNGSPSSNDNRGALLEKCTYLYDGTTFAIGNQTNQYWLETAGDDTASMMTSIASVISTYAGNITNNYYVTNNFGVRPTIDVKKTDLQY